MLLITCPVCNQTGDENEFTHGGEAGLVRPKPDGNAASTRDALYLRVNPRGEAREVWCCSLGCGKWFEMTRDTVSLDIVETRTLGSARRRSRTKGAVA